MEKIINVSGREVRLKSSAALPLRYKAQFGKDLFADMAKLQSVADGDITEIDTEVFYNVVWALAKCADPGIPPILDWLEEFEEFPVFEIFNESSELVTKSMGTDTKNAKAVENK